MLKKIYNSLNNFCYSVLPERLTGFMSYIFKFRDFRISYSDNGEDLILLKYLKYKKIFNGKYLDIGACHPRWLSNTHLLHKNGFSGFCVDLDENKLKYFKFARGDKVKTIFGAVSNKKEEFIDIYKVKTKSPFSLIDTASLDHARIFEKKGFKFKAIKVKNFHINDIFKITGKINVLNIDIEGIDFEVIKSCKLEIADPEVILIEDHGEYFPNEELNNFFINQNYYLLSICGPTKCFAKK